MTSRIAWKFSFFFLVFTVIVSGTADRLGSWECKRAGDRVNHSHRWILRNCDHSTSKQKIARMTTKLCELQHIHCDFSAISYTSVYGNYYSALYDNAPDVDHQYVIGDSKTGRVIVGDDQPCRRIVYCTFLTTFWLRWLNSRKSRRHCVPVRAINWQFFFLW